MAKMPAFISAGQVKSSRAFVVARKAVAKLGCATVRWRKRPWLGLVYFPAIAGLSAGVVRSPFPPLSPVAWKPDPIGPEFLRPRQALQIVRTLKMRSPEDCARRRDGILACGLEDGNIVLVAADVSRIVGTLARTGGRPLGMEFDAAGRLIVADARKGLLAVDPHGRITTLRAMKPHGDLTFPDDVAPDHGRVWLSNPSTRNGYDRDSEEFVELRATGQLFDLDQNGHGRQVLGDLGFANGLAMAPDGTFLLINETSRHRVRRLWLRGPRAGTNDIFVKGLPGYPDNLAFDGDGRLWIALVAPRDARSDALFERPDQRLREYEVARHAPPPPLPPSSLVLMDVRANVLGMFDIPHPALGSVTSVLPTPQGLVLGTNRGGKLALAAWPVRPVP